MPLLEHFLELRRRLTFAMGAIAVATPLGWMGAPAVLDALRAPLVALRASTGHAARINYPDITSAFDVRLEIALVLAVLIASPVWLYHAFAYVTPALRPLERRYTFAFFFSALPLFLSGSAIGLTLVPHVVEMMVAFAGVDDSSLLEAKLYIGFVARLVLVLGLAFVLPVFLVLFNFLGVLPARAIGRGWRVALLCTMVLTGLATPSADLLSMVLLAIPIMGLYVVAVSVCTVHDRAKVRRASLEEPLEALPDEIEV